MKKKKKKQMIIRKKNEKIYTNKIKKDKIDENEKEKEIAEPEQMNYH